MRQLYIIIIKNTPNKYKNSLQQTLEPLTKNEKNTAPFPVGEQIKIKKKN